MQATPPPKETPAPDAAARFAALQEHPDLPALLEHVPDTAAYDRQIRFGLGSAFLATGLIVLVGLGLAFLFGMMCPPLMVVPLAIAGFAIYAILNKTRMARSLHQGELQRFPALVVDERTHFGGTGDEGGTVHYVTLAFPDEVQREYAAFAHVPGKLTTGDMGVAYLRGQALVDFERLPV